MKKRFIAGLVLILIVGAIAVTMFSHPSETEENNTQEEQTPDPPQQPDEPVHEDSEPEEPEPELPEEPEPELPEEPVCYEIPESPEWGSDLQIVEVDMGKSVLIDPLGVWEVSTSVNDTWSQVWMEMTDTWYAAHYTLDIEENDNGTVNITAPEPGVYRLMYRAGEDRNLVDIRATKEISHKWNMTGVIFGDVWGELGSSEFNIAPDDAECRKKVLYHAMIGPTRVGANYVVFVPAAFYTQVLPRPLFTQEGTFLSLANESYYGDLVEASHNAGMKVIHTEQSAPRWDLTPEDHAALETAWSDPEWVDVWFEAWTEYVIPRAEMAEKYEVEMFIPYLFPEGDTFKAEGYVDHWRELLREIRLVYSGEIALNMINADERVLPLIDELDAVFITIFPGLYMSGLEDQYNPTTEEITEITEGFFHAPREVLGGRIPVYYVFAAQATDGQVASEDVEWKTSMMGLDFKEQVIYYEGFFKALEDETWVNGVVSERWDYFDQYVRTGEGYEAIYFDMTREASPRCKPAEDLIKLWFELLGT